MLHHPIELFGGVTILLHKGDSSDSMRGFAFYMLFSGWMVLALSVQSKFLTNRGDEKWAKFYVWCGVFAAQFTFRLVLTNFAVYRALKDHELDTRWNPVEYGLVMVGIALIIVYNIIETWLSYRRATKIFAAIDKESHVQWKVGFDAYIDSTDGALKYIWSQLTAESAEMIARGSYNSLQQTLRTWTAQGVLFFNRYKQTSFEESYERYYKHYIQFIDSIMANVSENYKRRSAKVEKKRKMSKKEVDLDDTVGADVVKVKLDSGISQINKSKGDITC